MTLQSRLNQFSFYVLIAGIFLSTVSCNSDDNAGPDAFWGEAKLDDFPLFEVDYLDISISHPEITDGVETKPGKINITIPFSQPGFMLSLKQFNLDNSKYDISPAVGEQKDFSDGPVRYTIFSTATPTTAAVHYDVTIVHGGDPFFFNAKITGFKFEKSKNPELDATIEAVKIAEYENFSEHAIYIIVPDGTDFSKLTPTITYDAVKLYYNTDNQFVLYNNNNMTVDFTYPKQFYLQAENSSGTKSLRYNVIVDITNPIRFETPIITGDVKAGNGLTVEDFFGIATWTNQGNHPITGMSPTEYKDKTYPVPDYPGDANVITASLVNPIGGTVGVLPGEQGQINVRVKRTPVTGLFVTTAVFAPTFSFDSRTISFWPIDDRVENIFNRPALVIRSTIVE
jgi:hypothetical protein